MGGIVGILNLDGRPAERDLLRRMTDRMAYRGPDAREIWADGEIALGHALLRTTFESAGERQPFSPDGKTWITADVRLDARADLLRELESRGLEGLRTAPDAELILHAYGAWREECLAHLHGDFSFAVWDGPLRRLFCARDRLGVKPFFYAHRDGVFVFSNTLNVLRMHPSVRADLNEAAIGDFLLFNFNQDQAATSFADIRRIPPGQALSVSAAGPTRRRYWTFPQGAPIRYKHAGEYVERFQAVFSTAVSDRLRTDRAGVMMSGGLDSSSVAAAARKLMGSRSGAAGLQAFTAVYDRLIPDRERFYAGLVAETIGASIRFFALDDRALFSRAADLELATPEPIHNPLYSVWIDMIKAATRENRVILEGQGGDLAFLFPRAYGSDLWQNRCFLRLAGGALRIAWARRKMPRVDLQKLNRWRGKAAVPVRDAYPRWLNKDFEAGLDLPGRWKEQASPDPGILAERSDAFRSLASPFWTRMFEDTDPNTVPFPLEMRNPFLDLRLLEFTLSIPVIPWIYDKYLLRRAMKGSLPEPVRLRPKTPMAADPLLVFLKKTPSSLIRGGLPPSPLLARFVDLKALDNVQISDDNYFTDLRAASLNLWLFGLGAS
jgi:asparagine synthase (glutamine-hydrolysing)